MSRVQCFHPSCHCSFDSEASMLQHFTDRHNHNQDKLACPHCNRSFSTKKGVEEHLRSPAHELNQRDASAAAAAAAADNDIVIREILLQDIQEVVCNDCGKLLKSTDSLHQHQWDRADHTRVSKSRLPNFGSCVRACSQCGDKFGSADHLEDHFTDQHPISEVPESSEDRTWEIVAERFISAWKKPTIKLDKVHHIFKVYNKGRRRKDFKEYRKELKNEMTNDQIFDEVRKKVLENGNRMTRYYGTTVKCRLGQPTGKVGTHTASALCTSTDCNLCRILQAGFKKSECKQDKFRIGLYTSSISNKAHGYVKRSSIDHLKENYNVMMVCKVLVGRPHDSTCNDEELEGPPIGFHSVQGDHELIVYDDRAILPAFVILYSTKPGALAQFCGFIGFLFFLFISFSFLGYILDPSVQNSLGKPLVNSPFKK